MSRGESGAGATRAIVEGQVERARRTGQTHWLARVLACVPSDPLVELEAATGPGAAGRADRFYWEDRDRGHALVAHGVVDEVESAGASRFDDVRAWARTTADRIAWLGEPRDPRAPIFLGGFAFEPEGSAAEAWKSFPAARFVLPEAIYEADVDGARRVVLARVEPGAQADAVEAALASRTAAAMEADAGAGDPALRATVRGPEPLDPDFAPAEEGRPWPAGPEYRVRADRRHAVFEAQVERALEAFEQGELEKVVLARSLAVDHDGELDVIAFLGRLRDLYPTCTLVAMGRGADTFLAATPETLVRVRGERVETAALAGSAPRGRDPQEDRRLGEGLLASRKERAEHAHVVEALRGALAPRCAELEVPPEPTLRRLFGIQHLETSIVGRLSRTGGPEASRSESAAGPGAPRDDVLGLVAALHPTPAVGGVPSAAAGEWLRRHEGLDRGWYAAPIGWLDVEGGGDFRVALRSGLIRNGLSAADGTPASRALLYAGAGLVPGSCPRQELAETRIKLRALLAPLTEI